MKEYCVDLELAKELKENGFPQENSNFYWQINHLFNNNLYFRFKDSLGFNYEQYLQEDSGQEIYSAPTSDEILKELPNYISKDIIYDLTIKNYPATFIVYYKNCFEEKELIDFRFTDKKLSNALAKMYIYLKKEGYIK